MERVQLISLLDASHKKNQCSGLDSDEVTSELSYHLRELQDEVYFWIVLLHDYILDYRSCMILISFNYL